MIFSSVDNSITAKGVPGKRQSRVSKDPKLAELLQKVVSKADSRLMQIYGHKPKTKAAESLTEDRPSSRGS